MTTPKLDMEQASNGPQCDSYSTSRESRCVLDDGHDSDHQFKQSREPWQIEIGRLTTLASTQAARIVELEGLLRSVADRCRAMGQSWLADEIIAGMNDTARIAESKKEKP